MPPRDAFLVTNEDVFRELLRRLERLEEQLARTQVRLAALEAADG